MDNLNLPITYTTPDNLPTVAAPETEVQQPSFMESMRATAYGAIAEGTTGTVSDYIETRITQPYITDRDRPKLSQDKVNQLWAGAGIVDQPPTADKYNDVSIYYLLDKAKRRTAMNQINEATEYGAGTAARGVATLGLSMLDPLNVAAGLFPVSAMARGIGLAKVAASMEALQVAGSSSATVLGRVGARAAYGAIEGLAGNLPLEAITAPMRNEMGEDYTAAQSLANLALGSAVGGGIHVVIGGLKPRVDIADRVEAPIIEQPKVAEPTDIKQFTTAKQGADTQVKFGDTYEPAQYVVIDASELDATMKKSANQFRDRTGAASQAQITEIANKLDPNLLMDSPTADSGAPTMAANGAVIAGNGRMAAIKLAYETKKGDGYKQAITQQAQQLGITDDISGMKQPILVRKLTSDKVDVERLAVISNETGAMRMSALEQSKVDSDRIGTLDNIATYDTGEINYNASLENIKAWVGQYPKEMRAALLAKDGTLSLEGQQRYKNAILHKAYGDTPLLAKMIESTDNDIKTVINAAVKLAPRVAIIKDKMQAGALHNLNIDDDLQAAITKYSEIKSAGRTVDNYVQQQSMLDDELSPSAIQLLLFIDKNKRSSRAIADGINNFYDNLENAGNPKQQTMFGDVVPSREQLLVKSLDVTYSAAELTEIVTPQTRENAVTMSVTQLEDNYSPTVDTIINSDPTIGKANFADVKTEVKNSLNLENSYVTRDIPELKPIEKPLLFDGEVDYATHNIELQAKIKEIEELQNLGLYSRGQDKQAIRDRINEIQMELQPRKKEFNEKYKNANFREFTDEQLNNYDNERRSLNHPELEELTNKLLFDTPNVKPKLTEFNNFLNKLESEFKNILGDKYDIYYDKSNQSVSTYFQIIDKDSGENYVLKMSDHFKRGLGHWNIDIKPILNSSGGIKSKQATTKYIKALAAEFAKNIETKGKYYGPDTHSFSDFEAKMTGLFIDPLGFKYSLGENPGIKTTELAAQMYKEFGDDAGRLLETGKIKIVESVKDLPGTHPNNVQAMYKDGQVYLVAKNIDPMKVKGVMLHEVGVHANMRDMLGTEGFDNLINQMNRHLDIDNPNLAAVIDAAIPDDTPLQFRGEERLAYLVENMPEYGFVKSLISKVKAWIYKTFPSLQQSLKLTDSDINELALSSLRNYASNQERSNAAIPLYSQAEEVAQTVSDEIDATDKVLTQTNKAREIVSTLDIADNLDNREDFVEYLNSNGVSKDIADSLYNDVRQAYQRALNTLQPNPEQYATKYALDKLENGLYAHKVALVHDKALKTKIQSHLEKNFATSPYAAGRSLTIGTTEHKAGARAYNAADGVRNAKRIYTGQLDVGLSKIEADKLFYSGALNDDLQRAMWALEDKADVSKLAPEAVNVAKLVMNIYDNQMAAMNNNGFVQSKVAHYLSNQQSLHNQTKILAAGYDNWKQAVMQQLDVNKTLEAMNATALTDDILKGVYQGLSTGEHIGVGGKDGNMGAFNPLKKIGQKPRKLIFKDADSVIAYRKQFGDLDFHSSIIGTIESTSKKIGLLQTLGVNYERNIKEIMAGYMQNTMTPEQRGKFRKFVDNNVMAMLKTVDGRNDVPFSEGWARFTSNALAIQSMAKLGGATLSAVSDLANVSGHLNRLGFKSTTYNLLDQGVTMFTKFSPERKQMLGSMGIFGDSILQNAYRDGYSDINTGQAISKHVNRFFKWTGLNAWTDSSRLGAADSLMNYMSGFTSKEHAALPDSLRNELKLFDINEQEWNLLRQTKQMQVDGNSYLHPQEVDNISDKISAIFAEQGLSDNKLETATARYSEQLKNKLTNFYHDGLAHMVIEPDSATKYYQTWGGLQPGSAGGVIARFAMQFKSFSIGFMRRILLDVVMDETKGIGERSWNLGKHIAATTITGYIAMSLKDIFKGREPRKLFDDDGFNPKVVTAALLQGGGAGIFGDFIFGEYNRFGGGLAGTLAGPAVGTVGDLASIYSSVLYGSLDGNPPDIRAKSLNFVLNNSPYINAFYARAAINYAFAYGLQEYMNPGYLRRLERNVERNNNQEFWLPPTEYAIQY